MNARHLFFSCLTLTLLACGQPSEQPTKDLATPTVPAQLNGLWQGVLPCASCAAQDWQLRLRDGHYQLTLISYQENTHVDQQTGTYALDNGILRLDQGSQFSVNDAGLTLLDQQGQVIESELNYSLQLRGDQEVQRLQGYYFYLADGHVFYPCDLSQVLPLQPNLQRLEWERQYSSLPAQEQGYFVELFGQLVDKPADEEGWPEQLLLLSSTGLQPQATCHQPLLEQRWQLLPESDAPFAEQLPELAFAQGQVTGFSGCNRFSGQYHNRQQQLRFSPMASTRMHCPDSSVAEQQLLQDLDRITHWQRQQDQLFLYADDEPILVWQLLSE